MQNAGLEPIVPYPGRNNDPWLCRCMGCGATVTPCYANINSGQGGCEHCGRIRAGLKQRTPDEKARDEMLAVGLQPLTPYPGVKEPGRADAILAMKSSIPDWITSDSALVNADASTVPG